MGNYLREKINDAYITQREVYNSYGEFLANEVYQYDSLVDVLFDKDDLFSDELANSNNPEQLLKHLLEASGPSYRDVANGGEDELYDGIYTDILMQESDIKGAYYLNWSRFKYISKHVNRYFDMPNNKIPSWHSSQDGLVQDGKRESMLTVYRLYFEKMRTVLPKGTSVLRARKFDPGVLIPSPIDESVCGPPPSHLARSMRMNPDGISYFYAAADETTCLLEVRASLKDQVVIGEFQNTRDLNIVDFTKLPEELTDMFHPEYIHNERLELEFLEEFQNEISIPYSDKDSVIEYIPTQILTEYIRYLKYDGVKFKSSLVKSGSVNYLFFCGNALEDPGTAFMNLLPPKVTDWFSIVSHKVISI